MKYLVIVFGLMFVGCGSHASHAQFATTAQLTTVQGEIDALYQNLQAVREESRSHSEEVLSCNWATSYVDRNPTLLNQRCLQGSQLACEVLNWAFQCLVAGANVTNEIIQERANERQEEGEEENNDCEDGSCPPPEFESEE